MNKAGAQAILDFIVAFAAITLLAVGVVRVGIWFNANFAKRQSDFQSGRLSSAQPHYPAYSTVGYSDHPLELTKEWVFKGWPSGKAVSLATYGTLLSTSLGGGWCSDSAISEVQSSLTSSVTIMRQQVQTMRQEAGTLEDLHDDCDDTWDYIRHLGTCLPLSIVGWFVGENIIHEVGVAADELFVAANEVETEANSLESTTSSIGCGTTVTTATRTSANSYVRGLETRYTSGELSTGITMTPSVISTDPQAAVTRMCQQADQYDSWAAACDVWGGLDICQYLWDNNLTTDYYRDQANYIREESISVQQQINGQPSPCPPRVYKPEPPNPFQ